MFKLCLYLLSITIVAGTDPEEPTGPCFYPINTRCWTQWFDRDDPSGTGDYEMLNLLRSAYPGKICAQPVDIEAKTLSGINAADTEDIIFKNDVHTGFICRTKDQCKNKPCKDYRVRFSCFPPFCGSICWTKWYDRDNPSGTGDWELLVGLQSTFPGQIPSTPVYIQAATINNVPAHKTGQVLYNYSPTHGFACRNKDQPNGNCRDYKVRFGVKCTEQQSDMMLNIEAY